MFSLCLKKPLTHWTDIYTSLFHDIVQQLSKMISIVCMIRHPCLSSRVVLTVSFLFKVHSKLNRIIWNIDINVWNSKTILGGFWNVGFRNFFGFLEELYMQGLLYMKYESSKWYGVNAFYRIKIFEDCENVCVWSLALYHFT